MNEDDIKRSIASAMEWSAQEQAAYYNAGEWLIQAARGEVPHGGVQPAFHRRCEHRGLTQTQEKPVEPIKGGPISTESGS